MSKILVTGGAGFIGSHLVDELIEQGHQVAVVDDLSTGRISNLNGHANFYEMSIESKDLERVFKIEKPDYVYHLAAQISVGDSFRDMVHDGNSNIIGSLNLFENCVKYNVKKVIFSSTSAVYGANENLPIKENFPTKPISPYGISKLTVETYLQLFNKEHNLDYVILRYANAFGPKQTPDGEAGVISVFIDNFLKGQKSIIHGNGDQTRDFVFVKDIVKANLSALKEGVVGIYNVSSNSETKIKDLYYTLKDIIGTDIGPNYDESMSCGVERSLLCNEKACMDLDLVINQSLEEALTHTVEYFKNKNLNNKVWIIMAAYNESQRIGKVLKALNGITDNIVVVDDYSKDNTSQAASKYRCHVVKHPINYGQGAALQAGMEYALSQGAEVLVHFDGDGQMQIKDIEKMVRPILDGEVDVTFGSRFLEGANNDNIPWTKKYFIHKPAIYLNWILTGMKMSDAHCGFRAMSAKAAKMCEIKEDRMAHATEILDLVRTARVSYKEVPVDILYHEYGQSFGKGFVIIKDLLVSKLTKL